MNNHHTCEIINFITVVMEKSINHSILYNKDEEGIVY